MHLISLVIWGRQGHSMGISKRASRARPALLATAAIVLISSAAAITAQAATPQTAIAYDMPAQPLASAVTALAQRSGFKLAYSASLSQGRTAPALRGSFTPAQALSRLLTGSGLTYRFTSANTVTIESPSAGGAAVVAGAIPLDTIDVQGDQQSETARGHVDGYVATRSATGTKTDAPLVETPAAISVVTQDQVQAQSAQSAAEAVRYTSGVRSEFTGSDHRFDYVYVRGFLANNFLDGMLLEDVGYSLPSIEPYNLERIEVLHGPPSVLYGAASPGGIIDMVSKRPTTEPYHEMFLSTGSYGRIQGGVDLSGPIDQNKEWLYRFTASGFDVGSQVDDVKYQRVSIAPSLTWRPDANTSVTFLATYQYDPKAGFFNFLPRTGTIDPLPNGSRIPTNFYPGEPSVDRMSRERFQVGYVAEHSFNDVLTVRSNFRYTDEKSNFISVFPTGSDPTNPYNIDRYAFGFNEHPRVFTLDNQAEAKFSTGPFQHTTLFGVDYINGTWSYESSGATGDTPSINVLSPAYGIPIPIENQGGALQKFSQIGLYAQDQIKIDRWVALLGVRWDKADTDNTDMDQFGAVTDTLNTTVSATTKRAALLYKFDNGIAPYIQYTESFQPTFGTDLYGKPFVPTTGQQEEVGVKYQANPKSLYTLALFNLVQQNVQTPDPNNFLNTVQTGEIRSRGLELEGKTELTPNLSVLASYTYLDNVITKSNTAIEVGRTPYGMPRNAAALWADYTFHGGQLDGLGFSGGVRYVGETTSAIDLPTVEMVPDVTLFDAAIHYDLSALGPQFKGYKFQINATNLFDRIYLGQCQDTGCYYGLRRQVIATLRYRW